MQRFDDAGDKFSPLEEVDWNFDAVPREETIACCLWEYARESKTINMAADQHWCNVRHLSNRRKYELDPELKTDHDKLAASIERRHRACAFDYENFVDKFWALDLALVEIYQSINDHVRDGARAWQKITPEGRRRLAQQVSQSSVLKPLVPAMVGELEKLWNTNRVDLEEIRSKPRADYDDSEDATLYADSSPVILTDVMQSEPPGKMAVAFSVDFTRFTNAEICGELNRWLEANRPVDWIAPKRVFPDSKQRGRKRSRKQTEYYTALRRLGLMRLLHWLTPKEIRRDLPEAWRKYGKRKDDFRREVREACKYFSMLFPYLTEQERPQSEPRKGIWFPQMMKICGKIENDWKMR